MFASLFIRNKTSHVFIVMPFVLMMVGCGSSSNGSQNTDSEEIVEGQGGIALVMTDAVTDQYSEVWVTIHSAYLIGGINGEGNTLADTTLFTGEKTVDLLSMVNVSELFLLSGGIPSGTYSKLRLNVSDVTLIRRNAGGNVEKTVKPSIVANGKVDLLARGGIFIADGQTTLVSIDFEAEKSIHLSGSGANGNINFRPVIFIESTMLLGSFDMKPLRIHGIVNTDSDGSDQIEVCNTGIVAASTQDACVNVILSVYA